MNDNEVMPPAAGIALRARLLALGIAGRAGWAPQNPGPTLSHQPPGTLYIASAQLLLIPTTAELDRAQRVVESAIREARSDALVISLSAEGNASFAVGSWSRQATEWHAPLLPWLGADDTLWLASGPMARSGFPLMAELLRSVPAPWCRPDRWAAGSARAVAWLATLGADRSVAQ